ncbi:MAG: hypothetical protein JW797_17245 [Bradymonadales bacterium]|nr:hypothetical protein [Bradymonadales bacterium]
MSLTCTRTFTTSNRRSRAIGLLAFLLAGGLLVARAAADEPAERRLCVYDPSGAVGDAYQTMRDFQTAALEWGVQFELRPYTDERTAAEDFNAGLCDAVLLTGVRARQYNRFAGTIEAMGAIDSYDMMRRVLGLLAAPRAGERMMSGEYETVAVFPAGAVYLFLRDRNLSNISQLAGKRVSTIDFDQAARTMVDRIGASMVPADISTFAGMFNNGSVDVCYSPATAYRPLELERGLSSGGGVIRFPIAQLTLQVIARRASFPEEFGTNARRYALDRFDQMLTIIQRSDEEISDRYWVEIAQEDKPGYENVFREVRIQLRDEGVYDGTMLTLLRRVRCQIDESRAECADQLE